MTELSTGNGFDPPPPPSNGGTQKEYLQRIEQKADAAYTFAQRSMNATLRLERALLGDYGNKGRIGLLEEQMSEFIEEAKKREEGFEDRSRFRISNRMAAISVIVIAIGSLGSIIVTLIK